MLGVLTTVLPLSAAHAQIDPLIEGAKLCTRHLTRYEREYGIPTHLLSAIASTESGRYHSGLKIKLPWPWTINAEGKGYMYDSKQEAIEAVRKFRAQGMKSIDVGCMQVNLYHHPNAFASLEEAFDPEYNIAYSAAFLRSLYQEGGSWKKAASDYHSRTAARGTQYVGIVYNSWFTIIDKLRNARIASESAPAETQVAAAAPVAETTPATPVTGMSAETAAAVTPAAGTNEVKVADAQPKYNKARAKTHMNHIEVRSVHYASAQKLRSHDNDILVVQTPISSRPVDSENMLVQAKATSSSAGHESLPAGSRKSGPNFIFAD